MSNNMEQASVAPLRVATLPGDIIEVGIGRDMIATFRSSRLVMLEINGLQYSPISMDQHAPWFKALIRGGMDPIMRDAVVIHKMVMDYLFDAAIKTRLGAGDNT